MLLTPPFKLCPVFIVYIVFIRLFSYPLSFLKIVLRMKMVLNHFLFAPFLLSLIPQILEEDACRRALGSLQPYLTPPLPGTAWRSLFGGLKTDHSVTSVTSWARKKTACSPGTLG